jgi:fatty-acyl-CoA synthase
MSVKAYDWIAKHAARSPNKAALVDLHSGRTLTYAEMNSRVGRFAHYLRHDCGIKRGDRVAVLCNNSTDVFEMQFACAKLGAVFLPLNWRLTVTELEFILSDASPDVMIYDVEFRDTAIALKELCDLKAIVDQDGSGMNSDYERGIAEASGEVDALELDHDDLFAIMYTSGTTGQPKGAMITHGMVFWNAINVGTIARVTNDSVNLCILPTFHTGGLNVYANPVFHAGGTVVVMRTFDPDAALELLTKPEVAGITHFLGVPANFLFIQQLPGFETADFSHLTTLGIGAAPCPVELLKSWSKRGGLMQQSYGMTETGPIVLVLDSDKAIEKVGSTGRPVMHTEVRLVDENGSDVNEPGEIGEIWARGPNVTPGYWNRPDATANSYVDGWLKSGDAARQDEDGFYFVVDRWKDMYISGGENVYPAEVENVLYQIPGIAEVAVIGIPDERWGEVGQAVVVMKNGEAISEEDVMSHCQDKLARFKQPRSVRFVAELPHNATGKLLKRVLRDEVVAPKTEAEA